MGLNAATFLHDVKGIVTGNGFLRSKQIPLHTVFLASSGAALTTTLSTNPGQDLFDTNIVGLSWAAAKVVPAGIDVVIPQDYDESQDYCRIRFRAKMAGSTNTPKIDATAYHEDDGTTDLDPTISAALSATLANVYVDLSGNSFSAGDHVTVAPFPEAHGTDAIQVYGIELEYKSCLVYFSKDSAR